MTARMTVNTSPVNGLVHNSINRVDLRINSTQVGASHTTLLDFAPGPHPDALPEGQTIARIDAEELD